MTNLTKVTMNLTDKDIVNTAKLRDRFHARSNAEAVSAALSITSSISDKLLEGDELLIKTKNGEIEKVIIAGLGV